MERKPSNALEKIMQHRKIIEYLLKVRIMSRVYLVPHLSVLKVVEKEKVTGFLTVALIRHRSGY